MARTIADIKAGMAKEFMDNETLAAYYGFTPGESFAAHFSTVSIESLLFYIVAAGVWLLESLFDQLRIDVDAQLSQRLTHNRQWYVALAKQFQWGHEINENTGAYDAIDTDAQIVANAAVEEVAGKLIMKVAKRADDALEPLGVAELDVFRTYISRVKDAGVAVNIISQQGDNLSLVIDIYYDPLVLDGEGQLLIDPNTKPVPATIRNFIQNLPFNGEFQLVKLVDALQITEGVVIPEILSAESRYMANDWETIIAKVKPYAGYMTINDDNLTVNYKPYDAD